MNTKDIPIPCNEDTFYLRYMDIMSLFSPLNLLSPQQIKTVALIMKYWAAQERFVDDRGIKNTPEDIAQIIFNTQIRTTIRSELGTQDKPISTDQFNNILVRLRKVTFKNGTTILDKNNILNPLLRVQFGKEFNLTLHFYNG